MSPRQKKGRSIRVSAIQYTHVVVVLIILQINLDAGNCLSFKKTENYILQQTGLLKLFNKSIKLHLDCYFRKIKVPL